MTANQAGFKKAMAQILGSKGVASINFSIKGIKVNGAAYSRFKKILVTPGKINIEFNSSELRKTGIPLNALYDGDPPPKFIFQDNLENATTLETWEWAYVVHESTHAVFDMLRVTSLNHVEEDVAARLAEQIFYETQFGRPLFFDRAIRELYSAVDASPGLEITDDPAYEGFVRVVEGLGYSSAKSASHRGF